MTQKTVVCPKCKTNQVLHENVSLEKDNVYQDDKGKFTVCKKCDNLFSVEI